MKFLIPILLLFAASLDASQTHRWKLNNSNADSVGSVNLATVGAPVSVTQLPVPIEGTHVMRSFTDANYLSTSAQMWDGITSVGSISVKFFSRPADAMSNVIVASNQAVGNFFILLNTDGSLVIRVPITGTYYQSAASAAGIISKGKWYKLLATFNGVTVQLKVKDMKNTVYTTAINDNAGATIAFSTSTDFRIGRDTILGGFSTAVTVDDVVVDTSATPAEEDSINTNYGVLQFGHSYALGTQGLAGSCGTPGSSDGYRWQFQNEVNAAGRNYLLSGSVTNGGDRGTVISPYTDGVAGDKAVNMLALINTKLATTYANPSAQQFVVLGPIEYNDCTAVTDLGTFKTQMDASAASVNAYSPLLKIVYLSGPISGVTGCDITNYANRVFQSFTTSIGLGYNAHYLCLSCTGGTICNDGIHPDVTPITGEYDTGGKYMADGVYNILNPTATPNPTSTPGPPSPPMNINLGIDLEASISPTPVRLGANY
jgi:hypothetical protein